MANYYKITKHVYNIKNQNGFKNALYDYFEINDNTIQLYTNADIKKMINNPPIRYPTTMVIIDLTDECNKIYLEYFDIHGKLVYCFNK